jgi:hypothetical protein
MGPNGPIKWVQMDLKMGPNGPIKWVQMNLKMDR